MKVFLVTILIIIIIGGLGFIGYSLLGGHSGTGHNNANATETPQQTGQPQATANPDQNSVGLYQANIILQNKESLNKSLASLNEALKQLTFDPYAPSDKMQNQGSAQATTAPAAQNNAQANPTAAPVQSGNNTTINIYPQTGTSTTAQTAAPQQNTMTMQNMGTAYDVNKMEQLHNGLYKMSLGMALLNQLQNQLSNQAENASINTQELIQYYTNQYNLTTQNRMKLTQALSNINEAANLVNINPYVSSDGFIYDKDRMNQIHQSVFKLADGVAYLNLLNDDFTRQSIVLANTVQTYINNANTASNTNVTANNNTADTQINHAAMSQGVFSNINIQTVINIILIVFVIGLIIGILGFTFSKLKPVNKNETV